ncbi:MAG: SoxR reducing system RseC family protein [PVC group bacterium]
MERGRVVGITVGRAMVRLPRQSGCAGCGRCAAGEGGKYMVLDALNPAAARPGDEVEVEISPRDPLRSALLLFGLPLLGFFIGVAAGYGLASLRGWDPSLPGLGLGVVLLSAAFLFIRRCERRRRRKEGEARVVRILRT